jgi:hypothetical protein
MLEGLMYSMINTPKTSIKLKKYQNTSFLRGIMRKDKYKVAINNSNILPPIPAL